MTPEEKFDKEVWWVLQEIAEEKLATTEGKHVEFEIVNLIVAGIPSQDRQISIFHKLGEWGAIKIVKETPADWRGSGRHIFEFELQQPKFDEVYRKYQKACDLTSYLNDYQEKRLKGDGNLPEFSQVEHIKNKEKTKPTIRLKSLELVAIEIGELDTGTELIDFLIECGVNKKLIVYPNTKWRMVYTILTTLATSPRLQDQETLFKIIEEAAHPLMHKGDEKVAKQYEDKFNNLLKYDNFVLKKGKLKKIDQEPEQDDKDEEDDEEDVFSYDDGISSPYENTDLELSILKKIQLEHKRRDDSGFFAKELSLNNNTLEEICKVVNKLMEDKILYLSANTRPERFENEEGIENKDGFINWKMVKKLDKNSQEMDKESGCVIFDMEILDEVKLKGRIDIAVEEFMNDKIYTPLGIMMEKTEVDKILESIEQETDKNKKSAIENALKPKRISYSYYKQRAIIIDEISKDSKEELIIPLNNFRDGQVDVLKTLLALEKENLLRITELRSNPMYDQKGNFTGKWSEKDNPVARIYTLKTQANKQEPMLFKIVEMPELQVKGLSEFAKPKQRDNKPKFPHKLPAGTIWEEITIKFEDDEKVFIQVKRFKEYASYKEMGFVGRGNNPNPSEAWVLLKVLAKVNGELTIKDPEAKDRYKKQKELLAKSLKSYFSLDYDPFYPYRSSSEKSGNSYKIKITLIPPPEAKEKADTKKDNDDLGTKEYLDEQNPQVDEDE